MALNKLRNLFIDLLSSDPLTEDGQIRIAPGGDLIFRDSGGEIVADGGAAATDNKDVIVTSNDTTPAFLGSKIVAGTNVTVTEQNDGSNESLEIAIAGGGGGSHFTLYDEVQVNRSNGAGNSFGFTINHSLGIAPKFIMLVVQTSPQTKSGGTGHAFIDAGGTVKAMTNSQYINGEYETNGNGEISKTGQNASNSIVVVLTAVSSTQLTVNYLQNGSPGISSANYIWGLYA